MAAFDSSGHSETGSSKVVWGVFFILCLLGAIFSAVRWEASTGILFCVAGATMVACPPAVRLPRAWWILAAVFVGGSLTVFLPVAWLGGSPLWRQHLESLGVATGSKLVVQAPQAFEMLTVFTATLLVGLWLAGHRTTSSQLRFWGLTFSIGVAVYAVLSKSTENWQVIPRTADHFGFFPNRNHTGTYLSMGVVCGLGTLLQGIRDKRTVPIALSALSIAISLWALIGWSISRGGVLLVGIGSLAWLAVLGPRYLGNQGRRAVALLAIAIVGGYLVADSRVKNRLAQTTAAAVAVISDKDELQEKEPSVESLDFRLPVALDTLDMIRDSKGFGIGPAQYAYVIPQYRTRTIVRNDNRMLHPESDWLWMASEDGIPAAAALLVLVVLAISRSFKETSAGRDRAIRTGCLVAATLVAAHGFFDVPGHRIPLAWSAAFLFALSFRTSRDWRQSSPNPWIFRIQGVLVFALGTWFIGGCWFGGRGSFNGLADRNNAKALSLYQEAVDKTGEVKLSQIPKLSEAIALAEDTGKLMPLDPRAYGLAGRAKLFFPARFGEAATAFKIERDLQPSWSRVPYLQGLEWAAVDPALAIEPWKETFRRSDAADARDPHILLRQRFLQMLKRLGREHPRLRTAIDQSLQTP